MAAVASLSLRLVWLAEDRRRALGCVAEAVIPRPLCAGTTRIAALVKVGDVEERGEEMGVLVLPTGGGPLRAVVGGAGGGCWPEREIEVVGAARGTDRDWEVEDDAARDRRESAATGALLSPSVGGMAVRGRRPKVRGGLTEGEALCILDKISRWTASMRKTSSQSDKKFPLERRVQTEGKGRLAHR